MGARSSPEGYRVAVGRYGLPVRKRARHLGRLSATGLSVALVLVAGCSKVSGSTSATPGKPAACAYVAKLDTIATTVAKANVADPDSFNKTLQVAVQDYVANVKLLQNTAPADLSASLARVVADVQQFRFDAAATDRVPLDAYAARSCGRVGASVATSTAHAATATTAVPPTPVPIAPTTTTTPSNG